MKTEDFYWLVGLLEGEGCFGITPPRRYKGSTYRYPKIVVQMTDEDVVRRIAGLFSTRYCQLARKPPHKNVFSCAISGARAADLMRELLPYMGERRRRRIDEILTAYETSSFDGQIFNADRTYRRAPRGTQEANHADR